MNEPWAIESILNGTGGGGGGGNPIPPITNIYVPLEAWQYQDRIIDVVGFPWVADVPYPNVKASDFVSVIFYQEDAESGIFPMFVKAARMQSGFSLLKNRQRESESIRFPASVRTLPIQFGDISRAIFKLSRI